MSAQPDHHKAPAKPRAKSPKRRTHAEFCNRDHPTPMGDDLMCASDPIKAEGLWSVSILGAENGPEVLIHGLRRSMPGEQIAALAAAVRMAADRIEGVTPHRDALYCKRCEVATVPAWVVDPEDHTSEWAETLTVDKARRLHDDLMAACDGEWMSDGPYAEPLAELALLAGEQPWPMRTLSEGLPHDAEMAAHAAIAEMAEKMPKEGSWSPVLWTSTHGDAIAAAAGEVPPSEVSYGDLWSGVTVPFEALHGLTVEQMAELRRRATRALLDAPGRPIPPKGLSVRGEYGYTHSNQRWIEYVEEHQGERDRIQTRISWSPEDPPRVGVIMPRAYKAGEWLPFDVVEAREFARALLSEADRIDPPPADPPRYRKTKRVTLDRTPQRSAGVMPVSPQPRNEIDPEVQS